MRHGCKTSGDLLSNRTGAAHPVYAREGSTFKDNVADEGLVILIQRPLSRNRLYSVLRQPVLLHSYYRYCMLSGLAVKRKVDKLRKLKECRNMNEKTIWPQNKTYIYDILLSQIKRENIFLVWWFIPRFLPGYKNYLHVYEVSSLQSIILAEIVHIRHLI